jgi:hypothetical protein
MNQLLLLAKLLKVITFLPRWVLRLLQETDISEKVTKIFTKGGENMNPLKSGFLTSEFVTVIGSFIVGILAMKGVIDPSNKDEILKAISDIAGAAIVIYSGVMFIWSRTTLKKSSIENRTGDTNGGSPTTTTPSNITATVGQ